MSKKKGPGEDGFAAALKLFGTVAAVATAGYHAVKLARTTSFPSEGGHHIADSVPAYLKSQILCDGGGCNTTTNSMEEQKKGASYTMNDLEILKRRYSEENGCAAQQHDYERQRWLVETLELLDNILESRKEVKRKFEMGDFSHPSNKLETTS